MGSEHQQEVFSENKIIRKLHIFVLNAVKWLLGIFCAHFQKFCMILSGFEKSRLTIIASPTHAFVRTPPAAGVVVLKPP
jgi:hypothetical protein